VIKLKTAKTNRPRHYADHAHSRRRGDRV